MSVLNQSGEEQVECPLCMEPLEVDDLNFFPCTCGYQICRFCWHRIRTDENGLCPACRKAYSENPADFIPLSKEQVAQLKAEKRQRDQQRKAKLSESRKHLASVRVVQRNLVFVVGLPMRLADPEVLKKYEYFGKFGKIHKVVINQSTAYAGTQGPSASAYVTYMKSDDALRAIQNVNNTIMDGKTIKTSLGTTKYCSHFMKNQPCPKPDCMYLHDFGDQEASFTKEQMHAGKHQEYEKKLHEALLSKLAAQSGNASSQTSTSSSSSSGGTTETQQKPNGKHKDGNQSSSSSNQQNKEGWPQLSIAERKEREKAEKEKQRGKRSGRNGSGEKKSEKKSSPPPPVVTESKASEPPQKGKAESPVIEEKPPTVVAAAATKTDDGVESNLSKLPLLDDNSSFFSQNSFAKLAPDSEGGDGGEPSLLLQQQHNEPLLEINDTDRWAFNFGYTKHSNHLEELAKQRTTDAFEASTNSFGGVEPPFGKLEAFGQMDPYNTENLLETLAKNGVNYAQSMQAPSNGHLNGLDQHMSKFFTDFYRNGFNQQQQQQQSATTHLGGLNGYHQHHLNLADKHTIAFLQQRQLEEQLMNLSLTKQQQPPYGHMNGGGQYDVGPCQNGGGPFGAGLGASQLFGGGGGAMSAAKSRPIPEEKELDFRFQEATKALEELVESDSHVHNAGRTNIGSSQINGLVHSQSSSHLPPPPPGFVQPNTHMNSFGSKILPYLNMNNSQQQQINSTQNSWPSNFSQTQQQQQQHKGMGMCNDWKILDPAILSSRRHIPNMPPLLDQYTAGAAAQTQPPLPRSAYDGGAYNNGFSNFSPLQQQQNYGGYSHSQPSLNWLGGEINTQISSPPGFRTSGQATKQQEC